MVERPCIGLQLQMVTQTRPMLPSFYLNIKPRSTFAILADGLRCTAPVRVETATIFQAVDWRLSSGVSRLAFCYDIPRRLLRVRRGAQIHPPPICYFVRISAFADSC